MRDISFRKTFSLSSFKFAKKSAIFFPASPKPYGLSQLLTTSLNFSSNKQVIENILKGKFPDKFIVSFGYTGWGPNQLENEIAQNAWEITDAHQEILFDTPNNLKINKLTEVSGFDPRIINQTQGSS